MIPTDELKKGLDTAFKKAGHNAYFGNGFMAGVRFATKYYEPPNKVDSTGALQCDECKQNQKKGIIKCTNCGRQLWHR